MSEDRGKTPISRGLFPRRGSGGEGDLGFGARLREHHGHVERRDLVVVDLAVTDDHHNLAVGDDARRALLHLSGWARVGGVSGGASLKGGELGGDVCVVHVLNVTRKIEAVKSFSKLGYCGCMDTPKRGRGRPPVEDARDNMRTIRMSDAEIKIIEEATEAAGVSLATFVREAALRAARRARRASA